MSTLQQQVAIVFPLIVRSLPVDQTKEEENPEASSVTCR